ncbi:MAG: hypothetical protein ACTSWR_02470 [Candidatus Helarchaeota archaeon]
MKSTSKQSKLENIIKIIKELSKSSKNGFTLEEFKLKIENLGIIEDKFEELFNNLINEGYLYQVSLGHYKSI